MACAFFRQPPSLQVVEKLSASLSEKSVPRGTCLFWTGATDRYGYGVHRVVLNRKRLKLHVHRLAFFLSEPHFRPLSPQFHVSHICHNKLCLRSEHLSYETASVNNLRKVCRLNGQCTGHRGFKRCQLDAVTIASYLVLFTTFICSL